MRITDIAIDKVIADPQAQPRVQMDMFTADEYKQAMEAGAVFPPIKVFYDGDTYWLADGFHRFDAAKRANGKVTIRAAVSEGGLRDAILYSVGANANHGIRRSNADKRRSVETLLNDPEWSQWSDSEIARRCRVHHKTVASLRIELEKSASSIRKIRKNGRTTTMNVRRIGRSASEQIPEDVRQLVMDSPVIDKKETEVKSLARLDGEEQTTVAEMIAVGDATSIRDAKRQLLDRQRQEVAEAALAIPESDRWHVYHGDIATIQLDNQYDFIITDPPYPKKYLYLYEVLARRASEWLKGDGLLIAMCGQSYLNEVVGLLDRHLTYYWTACYLTPGQPTPLRQRQVNTTWKPLLIYSRGDYGGKIFGDVFKSDANDKDFHKWGQSISGMYSIVSQVCLPGQSILDPFCGAGTTGIAALRHGCLFDGIELLEENVNISRARIGEHDRQ